MAFVHGKGTSITVDSVDLSAFTSNVAKKRSADSHDTTTFGQDGHTYQGGLTDGTYTLTGTYDGGASSVPRDTLEGALGTVVAFIYEQEVGTGKPKSTGSALITAYEETAPVADMITWSSTLQISGTETEGTQT
jgi:hypothetical protein